MYNPNVILRAANPHVRIRLTGRLAESPLQIFGSVNVLPMRLEERLPDMDVFPQVWVPGSDGNACSSGVALYEVDGQVSFGPLITMITGEVALARTLFIEIFNQILDILDSPMGVSEPLRELLRLDNVAVLNYTLVLGEFVPMVGWPCAYMSSVSQTLVGHEDSWLVDANDLHAGVSGPLQAECQTVGSNPGWKGKDYGGNLSVANSGRRCAPWKEVSYFNLRFSHVEGNSCR